MNNKSHKTEKQIKVSAIENIKSGKARCFICQRTIQKNEDRENIGITEAGVIVHFLCPTLETNKNNHKKINRRIDETKKALEKSEILFKVMIAKLESRVVSLEKRQNSPLGGVMSGLMFGQSGEKEPTNLSKGSLEKAALDGVAPMLNGEGVDLSIKDVKANIDRELQRDKDEEEAKSSCINTNCIHNNSGHEDGCDIGNVRGCPCFKAKKSGMKAIDWASFEKSAVQKGHEEERAVYKEAFKLVCEYVDRRFKIAAPALIEEFTKKARRNVKKRKWDDCK